MIGCPAGRCCDIDDLGIVAIAGKFGDMKGLAVAHFSPVRRTMDNLVENGSTSSELAPLIRAIRNLVTKSPLPSERALADKLNVKRHQLRRALHVLRANGEIAPAEAKRNGHGRRSGESLVRDTNPLEVIEMRIAIEPFLARLAALRASPMEMARIERAATTPSSTDSGAADLNSSGSPGPSPPQKRNIDQILKAIAASTGNNLAASLYALLRQVASDARVRACNTRPSCPKRVQQRDSEHRAIALAIMARDGDAAEQAMRVHLAAVQQRVIKQLNPLADAI